MSLYERFFARQSRLGITMLVVAFLTGCHGSGLNSGEGQGSGGAGTLEPVPDLPSAQIVAITPVAPVVQQSVTFDGTGSGKNVTFDWDFGDGAAAQGAQVTHAYSASGTFPITLHVHDSAGHVATATSVLTVMQGATTIPMPSVPVIRLLERSIPLEGRPIDLLAISTDVNGGPLSYTWNFGDGTTGIGSRITHAFATAGVYHVSVVATNSLGGAASGATEVVVTAQAPLTPPPLENPTISGPTEIDAQSPATFVGNAFSPDNSPLSFVWNFGDGTATVNGQTVTHTFSNSAEQHTVTLVVTDGHGQSVTATTLVTVVPLQPPFNVRINGPIEVTLGESADFSVSFENPAGNAVAYRWDFGDGGTSTSSTPSHTFTSVGQHTVTAQITDALAGPASASITLNVVQDNPLGGLTCATSKGRGWCNNEGALLPILPTALNSVSFSDERHGWIVGQNGKAIYSTDGGVTWAIKLDTTGTPLRSVSAVDADHAWILDTGGQIRITSDAGANWQTRPGDAAFGLNAVKFIDLLHGWAVGQKDGIIATDDGGQTWSTQNLNVNGTALDSVDFADANHGWAVGDGGYVLRTEDGGQSWQKVFQAPAGTALKSVSFADVSNGFIVGSNGYVARSADGGVNWNTSVSTPDNGTLPAVKFVTPLIGWVVTEIGLIYRTDDGGMHWTRQNAVNETTGLPSIDAVTASNAWIVSAGGGYLVTVTGGD